ncbi:MAG TPA: hypothetical protein VK324_18120 [Tepidisphaeraceae bacterium]|nr:hypothetical protein [Tepidisphaeraceae bacterium]
MGLDLAAMFGPNWAAGGGGTDFYGLLVPMGGAFDVGASEVPEPAAAALAAGAFVALLARRRPRHA